MSVDWDEIRRRRLRRDLAPVRDGLIRWLRTRHPGAVEPTVSPIRRASAGQSGETLLVDAAWRDDDGDHVDALVVRLPPPGDGLFPAYDLAKQVRVQNLLRPRGIPVPAFAVFEPDDGWIDAPFMVMARVPGRALLSRPSFLREGWLHDASPDQQRSLHAAFVDVLADLHRLDLATLDCAFLARPGGPTLAGELAWWDEYLQWASDGEPPIDLAEAMAWCRQHAPTTEPAPSLLWGDVQLVNAVFHDSLRPAALLDWEMAAIAPAEVDLGWFLAVQGLKAAGDGGDLPGFLGHDEIVSRHARRLGRELLDLRWFEAFAIVRAASIRVRGMRLLGAAGGARPLGDDRGMVRFGEIVRDVSSA